MRPTPRFLHILTPVLFILAAGCGDASSGEAAQSADGGTAQAPAATQDDARSGTPYASPEAAARAQQEAQEVNLARLGFNEGNEETAVVNVIEFSDFGCVHCANFHMEAYPELYREFVQGGDVVWKYIPITLAGFPNADHAAVAGECAGEQDRFPAMRDRLFETREAWMATDQPVQFLVDQAREVGLDTGTFRTCLEEGENARQRVADASRIARELGVRGTPTFVVQGYPVQGAPPLEAFQEVLRELVAEARGPGN